MHWQCKWDFTFSSNHKLQINMCGKLVYFYNDYLKSHNNDDFLIVDIVSALKLNSNAFVEYGYLLRCNVMVSHSGHFHCFTFRWINCYKLFWCDRCSWLWLCLVEFFFRRKQEGSNLYAYQTMVLMSIWFGMRFSLLSNILCCHAWIDI